jgi:hypothetical protein
LKQRDLRNQNLGDLKKGPNGGVSPTPPKKSTLVTGLKSYSMIANNFKIFKAFTRKVGRTGINWS